MKKILLFSIFALTVFGAVAQTTEQKTLCEVSVYFDWNKTNLTPSTQTKLGELLPQLKANPDAAIRIIGFTDKSGSEQANASMSLRRAYSVKRYFEQHGIPADKISITGSGVDTETTDNAKARRADIIVTVYVTVEPPTPAEQPQPQPEPQPKTVTTAPEPEPAPEPVAEPAAPREKDCFSLRTNLLYWVGGLPNLGFEWNVSHTVGIVVNGGYGPLASNSWEHNWGGWFVSPEVRFYLGTPRHWFVGAEFLAGGFNMKPGDTGYQGTMMAGGIVAGYKLPLGRSWAMDFTLGAGYGRFKYDTYERVSDYNVYTEHDVKKNIFMPLQAGVSLIWKIK